MDRAQHIIDMARRDAERSVPSHKESGTYGLITKVSQLESECGGLAAHIRVLCSEIADLEARLNPPAEKAGQFSATVECDQCTAHVVWQYEDGERGIYDVRLVGNAVLELGWVDQSEVPAYVVKAMDKKELADITEDIARNRREMMSIGG